MLKGAELILVPNACPMEINRLSQLRARAYENMLAIATCNYPDSVPDCNGGSSVFDGVAYLPELDGSRDMRVLQADGAEGIYLAELDLEQLSHFKLLLCTSTGCRSPQAAGCLPISIHLIGTNPQWWSAICHQLASMCLFRPQALERRRYPCRIGLHTAAGQQYIGKHRLSPPSEGKVD